MSEREKLGEAIQSDQRLAEAQQFFVWARVSLPSNAPESADAMVAVGHLGGYQDIAAVLYGLFDQARDANGEEGLRVMEELAASIAHDLRCSPGEEEIFSVYAARKERPYTSANE